MKKQKTPPIIVDDDGTEFIDYLAMHETDADMIEMFLDWEEEVLREENGEEGLAILREERKAIRKGKEEQYYAKLRKEGVDV